MRVIVRRKSVSRLLSAVAAGVLIWPAASLTYAAELDPLQLEMKIPLGDVAGRIDHMAVDISRQRLYVAELGNDSMGIVDLKSRHLLHRISGLKEPQGVGYVPATDTVYVSNAGDGSVLFFGGSDNVASGRIELGRDADNIRVDSVSNLVFVGYGSGGLAAIDPIKRIKFAFPYLAIPRVFRSIGTQTTSMSIFPMRAPSQSLTASPGRRQQAGQSPARTEISRWQSTLRPVGSSLFSEIRRC
jgi:DNA-binding beta-propeller fold protein YncE